MSKKEFVEAYALKSGESKKRSEELVNTFLQLVEESLMAKKDVQFVGWGTFTTKENKARQGRNPKTGETITIPEKRVIKFKVGKKLADVIAEGK